MKIFESTDILAAEFAKEFIAAIKDGVSQNRKLSIALSGGTTPKMVFRKIAEMWQTVGKSENTSKEILLHDLWSFADLYWGDERCVAPDDAESNYGAADELLLSQISIPSENIHRVRGEDAPEKETARYSNIIAENVRLDENKLPVFEWIILGIGSDGHTASIFPNAQLKTDDNNICGIAVHPETGQKRISLTLEVINNAKRVTFLASGKDKAKVINEIINKKPQSENYPAAKINPSKCTAEWFIDKEAGNLLS